jgi:hypothetical protein
MMSGLRERRRLCIVMILSVSLLFLPLTFSANSNNALAYHEGSIYISPDPPIARSPEELKALLKIDAYGLGNYKNCVRLLSQMPGGSTDFCHLASPPPIYRPYSSAQPLDCNQLGTCPNAEKPIEYCDRFPNSPLCKPYTGCVPSTASPRCQPHRYPVPVFREDFQKFGEGATKLLEWVLFVKGMADCIKSGSGCPDSPAPEIPIRPVKDWIRDNIEQPIVNWEDKYIIPYLKKYGF